MSEYVTTQPDGVQLPISDLYQNFVWNGSKINYIQTEYPPSSGKFYRQTFNYITGRSVTGVTVGVAGPFATYNGYTLTGPGEGAVLTPVFEIAAVAVGVGGTGYTVGDILDVAVGTYSAVGQVEVATVGGGGAITSLTGSVAGVYTAIPPGSAQPFALTGGTGTGGTANIQWGLASMTVVESGVGYTGASGITFDTSATTPTGTLTLTGSDATSLDSITGWELQP